MKMFHYCRFDAGSPQPADVSVALAKKEASRVVSRTSRKGKRNEVRNVDVDVNDSNDGKFVDAEASAPQAGHEPLEGRQGQVFSADLDGAGRADHVADHRQERSVRPVEKLASQQTTLLR